MLRAILHGKAGRIDVGSDSSLSWRDLFKEREDLLTGVFFGRFAYLTTQMQREVLGLLIGEREATKAGEVEDVEFWPRLSGGQRHHVEPDVLIYCKDATVMVEVKPPLRGGQSLYQWRQEIEALAREKQQGDDDISDTVHFVALGRNSSGWRDDAAELEARTSAFDLTIHMREWGELSRSVYRLSDTAESTDHKVLRDWVDAFVLFGLSVQVPTFDSMLQMKRLQSNALALLKSSGWIKEIAPAPKPRKKSIEHAGTDAEKVSWAHLATFCLNHRLHRGAE